MRSLSAGISCPMGGSAAPTPRSPFSTIRRRPTMADDKRIDPATGTEIKHHEWDGIQELDTPLPRWWLWTFYATILFAVGYMIAYPAIPMIDRATGGILGRSEEHTSELQSLMRISYAVFCLKKKK